jgi:hypothetical protein
VDLEDVTKGRIINVRQEKVVKVDEPKKFIIREFVVNEPDVINNYKFREYFVIIV